VVKLVEHPISVRQAFWLPYKRVAKLVGDQVEKIASTRDQEMHSKAAASVAETGKAAEGAPPAPSAAATAAAAPEKPFDIGALAAIGLAIGAIGSAVAAVATGFLTLSWWQMPLALVGVMLAISGPSMLIAWLRLRQRNLGPLLDAAGWAVNARAKVNIPFGASLTAVAALPPDAERSLSDPFAEKRRPWGLYVLVLAVLAAGPLAWKLGYVERWLSARKPAAPAAGAVPPASGAPAR
jgi:hypothetical protein